jgi:hypothetical protein
MKNIFKNTLKIAFICLVVILSSCEAEKDFVKREKILVRKFSMKEASKKGNLKLIETVDKVKNMHSSQNNVNSKIVFDEKSGLYFDDEKGIYIEKDEEKSYTFPIIRTSTTEKVQNICFNLKANGNYDVFLVKYNFTKEEASGLTDEEIKNREKQFITLLKDGQVVNFFRYVCIDVVMYITTEIAPPIDQGDLTGNFGTNPGTSTTVVTIASGCFFTNDSGGGDTGDGFNGGLGDGSNPGSGDNGGGVSDDSGIITGSIISDTEAQIPGSMPLGWIIKYFEDNLDKEFELPIYKAHPELRDYLASNNCNYESKQFVIWAISYLTEHPLVNFEKFKNWFMMPKEGNEATGLLDIIFLPPTPQSLPTFDDFILAFPSHLDPNFETAEQVYNDVGGAVLTKYNQGARNTCALRISRGLNNAGVTIPNIPGVTVKGADNKNYFLVAKNLLAWMKSTFGTPTGSNHLTGADGGDKGQNFPNLLNGKQGIYIMIPNEPAQFEASGHADMFFDGDCDGGCYFNATGGVSEIFFWELN